jgi:hypothetical protein
MQITKKLKKEIRWGLNTATKVINLLTYTQGEAPKDQEE